MISILFHFFFWLIRKIKNLVYMFSIIVILKIKIVERHTLMFLIIRDPPLIWSLVWSLGTHSSEKFQTLTNTYMVYTYLVWARIKSTSTTATNYECHHSTHRTYRSPLLNKARIGDFMLIVTALNGPILQAFI